MSEGAALPRSSGWMVSPGWDMAFIIASPLLIVPALWILAHTVVTPERLAIPVFAFATLGHHLPGYMRAYGDRELFARFRLRFVVVPPLVFVTVLLLVQPSIFGLEFAPPSSLQLLMVVWGAWHGLMQIYGFMRIYDAKQGIGHGLTQRLDLAICFAIFIGGFLFSDSRIFSLMDLVWKAGIPTFSAEALATTRLVAGIAMAALCVGYVVNMLAERRRGRRMGGVKLTLAIATGGIYTFSGLITTDLLLGAAVFEVFHAIQYLAIVWYFNRQLEGRVGDAFGPLRFLFRDGWSALVLYLGFVAAFGALFLAMGTPRYGPIVSSGQASDTLYILFSAFFVASSLLHYYYDGFIWKLHDRDTGRNLGVTGPGLREVSVPALLHFGKWSVLVVAASALIGLEISQPASAETSDIRNRALAELTPDVPEARASALLRALKAGNTNEALAMANRNAFLRPRGHHASADLARVHVAREDWPAAEAAYRETLGLHPGAAVYLIDLARVLARQGPQKWDEAAATYREALPKVTSPQSLSAELAALEARRGNDVEAARLFEGLLSASPNDEQIRTSLVTSLLALGEEERAVEVARAGIELDPSSAVASRLLGTTLARLDRPGRAAENLARAQRLDPSLPGIDSELGESLFLAGRYPGAEQALLRAVRAKGTPSRVFFLLASLYTETRRLEMAEVAKSLFVAAAPNPATGYRALGDLLATRRDYAGAETAYRRALDIEPDHRATQERLEKMLRRR
ncbi:MAG: tetratricopeptide repeat protein [Myxococcota bacterium]|nr:tetratricopeptide repeat protein [Myxococcota bacterium]